MDKMTDSRAAEVLNEMREVGDEADYVAAIDHAIARLREPPEAQAQGGGEVRAWMRRWAFDKVDVMALPKSERPRGWHLWAITESKCLNDDVPLYTTPPSAPVGVEVLRDLRDRVLPAALRYHAIGPGYIEEAQEIVTRALAQHPAAEGHPERWRLDDRELSAGRLKALHRGLELARKWATGTGVHGHTDTVVRSMAEELRVALSSQEGDYEQPAAVDWAAIRYALEHARDLDDGVARVVAALAAQPGEE